MELVWKEVPLDDVSPGDQVQIVVNEAFFQGTFKAVKKGLDGKYRFFMTPQSRPKHIADYRMSNITKISKAVEKGKK